MTKSIGISIRDIGLKKYLDAHKAEHRGMGYKEFVTLHKDAKQNITNLARAFNISRPTIMKWIDIYKEEQGTDK